jgi:hypothetical protein
MVAEHPFSYDQSRMGEALSVVAENGVHGMEYNGLIESWGNEPGSRKSRRARISPLPAYAFSGQEFEDYLILAWHFGLVEWSKYKEVDWKHGLNKSAYLIENEIVRLTKEGWGIFGGQSFHQN